MNEQKAQQHIVDVIKPLAFEKRGQLETEKKKYPQEWERPDFIWHGILSAFSTMGNSSGSIGLIKNKENYNRVTFEALSQLDASERSKVSREALRNAKVRWPDKKAEYLVRNFEKIVEMGGLITAREQLENASGRQGKIKFLKSFVGISDKYARDMMMDVYHPEFRDSIAVDTRVKNITDELGLKFNSYEDHENFYITAAHEAGLNGWEMDRLLYNFQDEVIRRLKTSSSNENLITFEFVEELQQRVVRLETTVATLESQIDQLTIIIEQKC